MSDLKTSFQKNRVAFQFPPENHGNLSQLNTFCSKSRNHNGCVAKNMSCKNLIFRVASLQVVLLASNGSFSKNKKGEPWGPPG